MIITAIRLFKENEMKTNKKSITEKQDLDKVREWKIGILSNLVIAVLFFGIQLFLDHKLIYSSLIAIGAFGLMIPISLKIKIHRLHNIVSIYLLLVSISGIIEYKLTNLNWITLEADYVHLGDVTLQFFKPSKPDGTSMSYHLNLNKIPSTVKMRITLRDVDPDERSGPLALYINGIHVKYLNRYFSDIPLTEEHEAAWRKIIIDEIPVGIFRIGENLITLAVERTILYGFDDVNFYDFAVGYK